MCGDNSLIACETRLKTPLEPGNQHRRPLLGQRVIATLSDKLMNGDTKKHSRSQTIAISLLAMAGFILAEKSDWVLRFFMPIGPELVKGMTICRILGHLIISVGLALAATKAIKDARKGDLTRMKIAYIVFLLLWPAIMMAINFAYYSSWRNFYQYLDTTSTETESNFVAKINAMQPGQKKSTMEHLHAQYIYRYEGKITQYQSPSRLSASYIPDEQDTEARRLITTNRALDHSNKIVMVSSMILYGFSYIWIFFFGFIAPKRNNRV